MVDDDAVDGEREIAPMMQESGDRGESEEEAIGEEEITDCDVAEREGVWPAEVAQRRREKAGRILGPNSCPSVHGTTRSKKRLQGG